MSADEFLDRLGKAGLLEDTVLAQLRTQVAASPFELTAKAVADLLVKRGQLTSFQANKLLGAPATPEKPGQLQSLKPLAPPASAAKPRPAPPAPRPMTIDEELGLAPLDDDEPAAAPPAVPPPAASPRAPSPRVPSPKADDLGLAPVGDEEDDDVVLLEDATVSSPPPTKREPKRQPSAKKPPAPVSPARPAVPGLQPLDAAAGLQPIGGPAGLQPLEPVAGLQPLDAAAGLQPLAPVAGLQPLDAAAGLQPFGRPAGPQPLAPVAGLQPLAPAGLQPLTGAAGLQPLEPVAGLPPTGGLQPLGAAPREGVASLPTQLPRRSVFETPLILFGGGALLLGLILIVALFFTIQRGSADEVFQVADSDYHSQSYPQAQAEFEKFLARFPDDPKASEARCKIVLARLWQLVGSSGEKRAALAEVDAQLPTIENEKALAEVAEIRADLASILPEIAKGFAAAAKAKTDATEAQELVDRAVEAMKHVNNPVYIPSTLRKAIENTLVAIQEDVDTAKRNINQSQRLTEAVAAMRTAVEAGKTTEAYDIRRNLLKEYPALETNAELGATVQSITQRQRDLVQKLERWAAPETTAPPPSTQFRVAVASRTSKAAASKDGHVVCVLARGAVFALQAANGQLLWRRFVGHEPGYQPRAVNDAAGADILLVDAARGEVIRLKADTGEVVWRLPLKEPLLEPVVRGSRIFLATRSGQVLDVEAETGRARHGMLIPQPLPVPPSPSKPPGAGKPGRVYQIADHSNLYVLDDSTLECQEVYYLGHKAGTIAIPPIALLGFVFVPENAGEDYCDLHVLATDADGLKLKPALKPFRLKGRLVSPPCVAGGRIILVTDLGEVRILEVNTANVKQPVIDAVEPVVASLKTPLIGHLAFDASRLWVANDRLMKYDIQTSTNRMLRRHVQNERDVFLAPPRVLNDTLFHLRRREHSPAYSVAAVHADDGRLLWEVDLAVPAVVLAGDPAKKQISAVSAQAELFDIPLDALKTGRVDQAAASAVGAARTVAFTETVPLGNGRWVLASPQDRSQMVLYEPQAASVAGRLRVVKLPASGGAQVTAPPVVCGGGILLPWDQGQIALLDPASGENKAVSYQSRIGVGEKVRWQRPAVLGGGTAFVIADDRRKLCHVALQDKPQPHLALRKEVALEVDVVAPLAAAGDTVYAVVRGPATDTVKAFAAGELAAGTEWSLEGRVAWGPETVGEQVLIAGDRGQLLCFDPGGKQRWTTPLPYGPLAGPPLRQDQDLILASQTGVLWRVSGADGKEVRRFDAGEPLSSGVVPFSSRLLASGSDGTVYVFTPLPGP